MSEEQLKAAKFAIIQRYQDLKGRVAVIESRLKQYGHQLKYFGDDLVRSGRPSTVTGSQQPKFDEITALLEEQKELHALFSSAMSDLKGIGMEPF
jgi:hypothetical protein